MTNSSHEQTDELSTIQPSLPYMFRGVQFHPAIVAILIAQFVLVIPALLNTSMVGHLDPMAWRIALMFGGLIGVAMVATFVYEGLLHPIRFVRRYPVEMAITAAFFAEMFLLQAGTVVH